MLPRRDPTQWTRPPPLPAPATGTCSLCRLLFLLLLLVFAVSSDQSPTLLDRFAAAFDRQPIPAAGPVLPVSLPLPPDTDDQVRSQNR